MRIKNYVGKLILVIVASVTFVGCDPAPPANICDDFDALPSADYIGAVGDSIFNRMVDQCQDVISQVSYLRGEGIENWSQGGAWLIGQNPNETDPPEDVKTQLDNLYTERGGLEILIITGGGNEILDNLDTCLATGCPDIVDDILENKAAFLADYAKNTLGIEKILYVGYDVTDLGAVALSGILNSMMDRVRDEVLPPLGVEFVDMRGTYGAGDTEIDGFHPLQSGAIKFGARINEKLDELGW